MFFRQLRSELWKLFGKKRTYIGFGAFLVAQCAMLLVFHSYLQHYTARLLEGNGYLAATYLTALTVAVIMLMPQVLLLMPLYACLVGGDMVAKEAEDGTLRMILCRPITRFRLLAVKWVTGLVFCVALVLALGAMALLLARLWFPWGSMFVSPLGSVHFFSVMTAAKGFGHYALAHAVLSINALTMFSLAFMFSCFNMKPAAATILAISFFLSNLVMENMPFYEEYKEFFITTHFRSWLLVFSQPADWSQIFRSLSILFGFNCAAFIIGLSAFHVRDIKS
jgi:ABC-2 type transport system permease protein